MNWWFVSRNGETAGPVPDQAVVGWIRQGMRGAMLRDARGGPWIPLEQSPFASMLRPRRGGNSWAGDGDDTSTDTGGDFAYDGGDSSAGGDSGFGGDSGSGGGDSGSGGGD